MFRIEFTSTFIAVIFIWLSSYPAHAQVATAGFSPENIGFNPAAITSRDFGIFGILGDTLSQTDVYDNNSVNPTTDKLSGYRIQTLWSRDFFKRLSVEMYGSYINGTETSLDLTSKEEIQIYLGNTSFDVLPSFHIGAQYYVVSVNGTSSSNGSSGTAPAVNVVFQAYGGGVTYDLFKGFTLGAVSTKIGIQGFEFTELGFGASYTIGSLKTSALRLEISHMTMTPPSTLSSSGLPTGVQDSLTIEGAHSIFSGGVTIQNTENLFFNPSSDIKTWINTFSGTGNVSGVPQDTFAPTYRAYIGFKSTAGHSFSLRGSSSNSSSDNVYYQGRRTTSTTQKLTAGFTYAFLF